MDVGLFMDREKRISIKLESKFKEMKLMGQLRNKVKVKELINSIASATGIDLDQKIKALNNN